MGVPDPPRAPGNVTVLLPGLVACPVMERPDRHVVAMTMVPSAQVSIVVDPLIWALESASRRCCFIMSCVSWISCSLRFSLNPTELRESKLNAVLPSVFCRLWRRPGGMALWKALPSLLLRSPWWHRVLGLPRVQPDLRLSGRHGSAGWSVCGQGGVSLQIPQQLCCWLDTQCVSWQTAKQ